jgi:hypothetical protein
MTMTTIHLRSGHVLEFQQRRYGVVVLLDGAVWCSPDMLVRYLLHHAIEHDDLDALRELYTLLPENGRCSCGRRLPRFRCEDCGVFVGCDACLARHRGSLCQGLREHAEWSRRIAGREHVEPIDCASAIRAFLPTLERMGHQ